jgi:hypothetical protein
VPFLALRALITVETAKPIFADSFATIDSWIWPLRHEVAATLSAAAGLQVEDFLRAPALTAHRELDRLASLTWSVRRGEPGAQQRLTYTIDRLTETVPWIERLVASFQSTTSPPCNCADSLLPQSDRNKENIGDLIDDGAVCVLLANVHTVAGEKGAKAVIGLFAAALIAEQGIPGATTDRDASGTVRDLGILAGGRFDRRSSRRVWVDAGQIAPAPMHTLSEDLPGGPIPIPGLPGPKPSVPGGGIPPDWRPKPDPDDFDQPPLWPPPLNPKNVIDVKGVRRIGCLFEFYRLLAPEPAPAHLPPGAPITWTAGIDSVEVTSPCAPKWITLHGTGFGINPPPGVGVVASMWDAERLEVVCRPLKLIGWSDTTVTAEFITTPTMRPVGGVAGFADVAYIQAYNAWAAREDARVAGILATASCAGIRLPPGVAMQRSLLIPPKPFSACPTASAAVTYQAGDTALVLEIAPLSGPVVRWLEDPLRNLQVIALSPGQPFRLTWTVANTDKLILWNESADGVDMLGQVFAGLADEGLIPPVSGSRILTAPSLPVHIGFHFVAENACGGIAASVHAVVVCPPVAPARIDAVAPLPAGTADVIVQDSQETFIGDSETIPLVANKRTVIRLDWQGAIPQVPKGYFGETTGLSVSVRLWAICSHPSGTVLVELPFQPDTAQSPPPASASDVSIPAKAFSNAAEYAAWRNANEGTSTLNAVLPASLATGEVVLSAAINAYSPMSKVAVDPPWFRIDVPPVAVKFHPRRGISIKYQRWGNSPNAGDAPSDDVCVHALQVDGSLLPAPDPPIAALPGSTVVQNGHLVEDLFAQKTATPGAAGWYEIWFVMGPFGSGGIALPATPWTGANCPNVGSTAHEIGHMFGQHHLNDAVCGPRDGESPATFPDQGSVLPVGWNQWDNAPVVGAKDIMTYCPQTWISPERWRRLFKAIGL